MAKQANKKSFNLSVVVAKSFDIFVANFQAATTILFEIIERIEITFAASLRGKLLSTINVKRIRILLSQVKLRVSITQTINSKRITASYTFRQLLKAVTIASLRNPLTFISSARQKLITILSSKTVRILTDPILATFYILGNYDPDTLGTMDTETLGDLDYLET